MKRGGFTLVEMLVAVALLALLIGVAVFAFRLQLLSIHKMKTKGINDAIAYHQLRSAIASMKFYVVEEYDALGRPMKRMHYFFDGTPKAMTFVTTNALFGEGDALARLECRDGQLRYAEAPLFGRIDFLRPALPQEHRSIVLYDDLQECGFAYEGYDGLSGSMFADRIPVHVAVELDRDGRNRKFFIAVKSDDNMTKARVHDAVYPTE
jgi:prepilin-type N-terminal cleavage/methylation domain-containing protein